MKPEKKKKEFKLDMTLSGPHTPLTRAKPPGKEAGSMMAVRVEMEKQWEDSGRKATMWGKG